MTETYRIMYGFIVESWDAGHAAVQNKPEAYLLSGQLPEKK